MYEFSKLAEEDSLIKLLDLKEDVTIIKKIKYPEGELTLPFCKTILEAPFLVLIARLKAQTSVVLTLGLKNVLVGVIQKFTNRRKIHRDKFIHNIITSIVDFAYPDLVILDGTVGVGGGGPIFGTEIKAGWALASFNALTANSLATHLMGFDIDDVGYLNLLREKEIGALFPKDEIEILGKRHEILINPFKPHKSFKKRKIWR